MKKVVSLFLGVLLVLVLSVDGFACMRDSAPWSYGSYVRQGFFSPHWERHNHFARSAWEDWGWGYNRFSNAGRISDNPTDLWMAPRWEGGASSCVFTLELPQIVAQSGGGVTDASLVLSFKDDGGFFDGFEYAALYDGYERSYFEVNTGNYIIPISEGGLTSLNRDGSLAFTLDRLFGDFTLLSARLAVLQDDPIATPIPASAWLVGSMLCAFFGLRKRGACA